MAGFWGPKMEAAIGWGRRQGIPENLPVCQRADRMDELTGVRHRESDDPEMAAERWLAAIAEREAQNA